MSKINKIIVIDKQTNNLLFIMESESFSNLIEIAVRDLVHLGKISKEEAETFEIDFELSIKNHIKQQVFTEKISFKKVDVLINVKK